MRSSLSMTKSIRQEDVDQKWWVVDAQGQTVGRLATQVATLLRGKHKPYFTPHVDCGDFVVVINAEKIELQGKRAEQKEYFHYTGYPGGARVRTFKQLLHSKPSEIIQHAVHGMLPKNTLGSRIESKLRVYAGDQHPHIAQKPEPFELKS